MTKYLYVTFSNREIWRVEAEKIAKIRAEYYVDVDIANGNRLEENRKKAMKEEIDFVLNDTYEIIDWASNNMNWEDLVFLGIELFNKGNSLDYEEGYSGADLEVQ